MNIMRMNGNRPKTLRPKSKEDIGLEGKNAMGYRFRSLERNCSRPEEVWV